MKRADVTELDRITSFLKENLDDCVYIYIDISKYGLEHPDIELWFSDWGDGINSVAMKYYDSFQLFSKNSKLDVDKICQLLEKYPVKTISGSENIIKEIAPRLSGCYDCNYGIVVKETRYKKLPGFEQVEEATINDCYDIACLMCEDEEFGRNYDVDVLTRQLADRIDTGMGKSYVLREEEKIVGHVATFAEVDDLVVLSGLIVSPLCKNRFGGIVLHEYLKSVYLEEGKFIYAFRIKDKMQRYEKSPGTIICGNYGKLTKVGE